MKTFVDKSSIVKKIWSATDMTLFIFAGAAAEFALNKQVDWLYFTGKLPADPIGRLFSTVQYAQAIIFSEEDVALGAIDRINTIHQGVESARGRKIPQYAYKDVLYMLIHYSMASFELLERKLTPEEKDEVVQSFSRIGDRMHIKDIPGTYEAWSENYQFHLQQDLENGNYTRDLFLQYRKHLGAFRYFVVLEVERMLVPEKVNELLGLGRPRIARFFVYPYRLIRKLRLQNLLINMMVPEKFRKRVKAMEQVNTKRH